jgi:uncharacterized protein YdeI (YjbR/CyaY-like superfamily)
MSAATKSNFERMSNSVPRVRRPELPLPESFATALNETPQARTFFEKLPPSCRREYIEWISSAKKEETVTRRLKRAMAMLAQGRRRHL